VAGIIADDVLSNFRKFSIPILKIKFYNFYTRLFPYVEILDSNEHITRGEGINCCKYMGREKYRELRKERVFFFERMVVGEKNI
jgi:hypothetical protein